MKGGVLSLDYKCRECCTFCKYYVAVPVPDVNTVNILVPVPVPVGVAVPAVSFALPRWQPGVPRGSSSS